MFSFRFCLLFFFFFNDTATTEIYTLSLHDALPISNVVDITNYAMLALGNPLHAFDRDKLVGKVIVRRARPGELLVTLDGMERTLEPEDLVIADEARAIALAGIMGGSETEITEATNEVLLE